MTRRATGPRIRAVAALQARWELFEPVLESGHAEHGINRLSPELEWVRTVAADLGVNVTADDLDRVDADWDLTRRSALLDPPAESVRTLVALRERAARFGVLSNTHGLEVRAWDQSPLARLFDATVFSHEMGACKPDPVAYARVLDRLDVPAASAAYVGDGSSNELVGAKAAGFGLVILAEEAPVRWAQNDLPRLRAQADIAVSSLLQVVDLLDD